MPNPILSGTNFQVGEIADLEGQLARAAEVQRSLLPQRHRRFSGWEVGYTYEPAEFVSGDYVDLIPAKDGGFYFVLGDVSGKGIPASILMSHLHATLRAFLRMDLPLSEVLERTSQIFCEITIPAQFATLVVGRAASDGTLDICNAGHVPVVLVGGDGIRKLSSSGPPVGVFCKQTFTSLQISAAIGDILFLYTDGLSEAQNQAGEEYGEQRIERLLSDMRGANLRTVLEAVSEDVNAFSVGKLQDDRSVLLLKRM